MMRFMVLIGNAHDRVYSAHFLSYHLIMSRKTLIFLTAVLVLGAFVFVLQKYISKNLRPSGDTNINTSSWVLYENKDFGFRIKYPSDWMIYEDPNNVIQPAFNIYPKSIAPGKLPLIHHSVEPNVSIFPAGVPTEGVIGKTTNSSIDFINLYPKNAFDYTLENGDVWATFVYHWLDIQSRQSGLQKWTDAGFLWARAEIDDYVEICLRDGSEMPVESCDFFGIDVADEIVYRGRVNKETRAIQEEILKSFEFTVQTPGALVRVDYPKHGDVITNPLIVTGEARGNWYFEATFPVALVNWDGLIIAEWYAEAQLDPNDPESTWMTTDFVPFRAELKFENPSFQEGSVENDFSRNGYLIISKSNASGLSEHDSSIEIPVRFEKQSK
ncbi:MAG TPA: Gmad2 immunoglobulin-like domain-containing protein [Candidatus Paceibacterota bacterium]